MRTTRREFIYGVAGATALCAADSPSHWQPWTQAWDRALLMSAVKKGDYAFDAADALLIQQLGAEYHAPTRLRNVRAHLTKESVDYALNLLETGDPSRKARAEAILNKILPLQESNPKSPLYGIWGYYQEEPADKMATPDYNWGDFIGSSLLMIHSRHSPDLPDLLNKQIIESIHRCATASMRRNVEMTYTNVAVAGTFLTLGAAALVNDELLRKYSSDRMRRLCAGVDQTGSFAEYNSPTYANVVIANLTKMKMVLKDPEVMTYVSRLHDRIWLHLSEHWHAPTEQLAGPMSRSYGTDIGKPLWLQKALGGAIPFATLQDVASGRVGDAGEVSYLQFNCPDHLRTNFQVLESEREHRELFDLTDGVAVQGTTFLSKTYCLGTANRSDLWTQRRPLLAYWGGATRPARYMQLRFLKDDHDFSSALLYTVQSKSLVAFLINFQSPGGDQHPLLDPIKNGQFQASRMRMRLDLAQVSPEATILVNGVAAKIGQQFPTRSRVTLDLGGAFLCLQCGESEFSNYPASVELGHEDGMVTVSLNLIKFANPSVVRWGTTVDAHACGTIQMTESSKTLASFDAECARTPCQVKYEAGQLELLWRTPSGELKIFGGGKVATRQTQDKLAGFSIGGQPVPIHRLSEQTLVG